MRVLLTTDTIGGVWTFTQDLTAELLGRGHAVALVSFGQALSLAQVEWCQAAVARFGTRFRYDVCEAALEWMAVNEEAYTGGEALLLRVAEEFGADLMHANQFCFGGLPVSIPKVITAHSDVLSWAVACRPEGLDASPWLDRYMRLVGHGLEGADAVVAPTQWMLDALQQHFPVTCPVDVVLNGRNVPLSTKNVRRRMQAVSVGRMWDEAKNLMLLTQMDAPMPVLVAGAQRHEDAFAPHDLGKVEALGRLEETELLALFRSSSVYVVPSVYEPFGLGPLEAAQCGCAVVANDLASLREVWGDAALYFQDAAGLEHVLQRLCQGDALRKAQEKAKRRAWYLTASRMADGYVTVYNRLLASPPPVLEGELAVYAG